MFFYFIDATYLVTQFLTAAVKAAKTTYKLTFESFWYQ